MKIASLGSALQDIYLIDHDDFISDFFHHKNIISQLETGSKVDIDQMEYTVGGGGINSAVTFSRAGHKAYFIGSVGNDIPSYIIRNRCKKDNINTAYLYESQFSTGCSVILLDKNTGERTILTHRGASKDFTSINPKILLDFRPDWLYITTLQGDFNTLTNFINQAHALGIKIMLNPGKKELEYPKKLKPLLSKVDILMINDKEANTLVGEKLDSVNSPDPKTLLPLLTKVNSYAKITIITSGNTGGCISILKNKNYYFGLYENVPVLDTTGAGDAFGSGFLSSFVKYFPSSINTEDDFNLEKISHSLAFASANSTNVIQYIGANSNTLYMNSTKLKNFSIHLF